VFNVKPARVPLHQIRCVDKVRLTGKLGQIDTEQWHGVLLQMLA
jgi:mRNA interferase MazF